MDIKTNNKVHTFTCFPHYNNSISIYKSHERNEHQTEVHYKKDGNAMQIFTPIREDILQVKQIDLVHRIVIAFNPLGINHFLKYQDIHRGMIEIDFFTKSEINAFFAINETDRITEILDNALLSRLNDFQNDILEKVIQLIVNAETQLSIEELAHEAEISRRHLNRLFKSELGVSAKKFQEIVVFRKALTNKIFENPTQNLTTLAHEYNYSDQSHLIKTFKKLTQNSPKKFFEKGKIFGEQDIFWH